MPNWHLTFGQKYCREPHPLGPQGGNPNGYVTVKASSLEQAIDQVWALIGDAWSMLYSEEEFTSEKYVFEGNRTIDFFPDGCSGVIMDGRFTLTSELTES